jgi:hypothetical protein
MRMVLAVPTLAKLTRSYHTRRDIQRYLQLSEITSAIGKNPDVNCEDLYF